MFKEKLPFVFLLIFSGGTFKRRHFLGQAIPFRISPKLRLNWDLLRELEKTRMKLFKMKLYAYIVTLLNFFGRGQVFTNICQLCQGVRVVWGSKLEHYPALQWVVITSPRHNFPSLFSSQFGILQPQIKETLCRPSCNSRKGLR